MLSSLKPLLPAVLLCLLSSVATAEQPVSESALARIREMRKQALERRRRVWFNHDGCDAYSLRRSQLKGPKATPQTLLDVRTTPLAETQVDTLSYCTISSGFSNFTHRTKIGHTLTDPRPEDDRVNTVGHLIEQGTDPLEVMIKFCHAKGREIFWSMRMNDTHDAATKPGKPHRLFPKLKKDRPKLMVGTYENKPRFGTWTSVDYTLPEIRDLCYQFVEEVCRNYDVDGIEMDFFRHLCYFKSVAYGAVASQGERDMMTALLARIRRMTEREGVRRGRPFLVAVRVPDSVEYSRGLGLDFERWMADGLIDCLIGSGYFRLNDWSYLVELGHKYGVKVYPCLSETRVGGWDRSKRDRQRASDATYRARAAACWHAGADGIYVFNEYNAKRGYLHDIGALDTLRGKPKSYYVTVRDGGPGRYLIDGSTYLRRPMLCRGYRLPVTVGEPTEIELMMGEDLGWTKDAPDIVPEVRCRVEVKGVAEPRDVRVAFNGQALDGGSKLGRWLDFPVDPQLVKNGANRVGVALAEDAAAEEPASEWTIEYRGSEKLAMPKQLPWRRLFRCADWVEEVRDGALFFADRSSAVDQWANLAYPWLVSPKSTIVVEARVKVVSSSDPRAVCLRVSNGRAVEYLTLEPRRIGLHFAGVSCAQNTTAEFHTYRIEIEGDDVRVSVDGVLKFKAAAQFTTSALDKEHWLHFSYGKEGWNRSCLVFGSCSGAGKGEALWEFVRYHGRARAWTDLVVTVSYPKLATAITDWELESVLTRLPAAPWKHVHKTDATVAEVRDGALLIADRGTQSGDYDYFACPWDVKPETGATAEARVKVESGWCSITVSDGVHEERVEIHADGLRTRYSGGNFPMVASDDFHLYRVTIKGEDVQVHVDGKLRVDGRGRFTHAAINGRNTLQFGAANSPSLCESYWRLVRFTRQVK